MEEYKGYSIIRCTDQELSTFYQEGKLPLVRKPHENEYFVIKDSEGNIVDKRCWEDGEFRNLKFKPIDTYHLGQLRSKNLEQDFAFDMLQNQSIDIKLLAGNYGSGKSLLMVAHALEALEKNRINKIIFVRNNIELKDTTPLGALPGTATEKMLPWAGNIGDHLGSMDAVKTLIEKNELEIAPLGYLRGRDFRRSIIFCDEAENLTTHQCQLLIGRIGEGSQLWFAGDRRQTDKTIFEKDSGMKKMVDRLSGKELFGYVYLPRSERSRASAYADLLD